MLCCNAVSVGTITAIRDLHTHVPHQADALESLALPYESLFDAKRAGELREVGVLLFVAGVSICSRLLASFVFEFVS